jgi:hypothetical protein
MIRKLIYPLKTTGICTDYFSRQFASFSGLNTIVAYQYSYFADATKNICVITYIVQSAVKTEDAYYSWVHIYPLKLKLENWL